MKPIDKVSNIFSLLWIIINPLGWLLFIFIGFIIGSFVWNLYQSQSVGSIYYFLEDENNRNILTSLLSSIAWGFVIGILQQSLLERYFQIRKNWVVLTIIGFISYIMIGELINLFPVLKYEKVLNIYIYQIYWYISFIISPIILAIIQWLELKKYFYKMSYLWVIMVSIALYIAHTIQANIYIFMIYNGLISEIFILLVQGILYGISTLIVLIVINKYWKVNPILSNK